MTRCCKSHCGTPNWLSILQLLTHNFRGLSITIHTELRLRIWSCNGLLMPGRRQGGDSKTVLQPLSQAFLSIPATAAYSTSTLLASEALQGACPAVLQWLQLSQSEDASSWQAGTDSGSDTEAKPETAEGSGRSWGGKLTYTKNSLQVRLARRKCVSRIDVCLLAASRQSSWP